MRTRWIRYYSVTVCCARARWLQHNARHVQKMLTLSECHIVCTCIYVYVGVFVCVCVHVCVCVCACMYFFLNGSMRKLKLLETFGTTNVCEHCETCVKRFLRVAEVYSKILEKIWSQNVENSRQNLNFFFRKLRFFMIFRKSPYWCGTKGINRKITCQTWRVSIFLESLGIWCTHEYFISRELHFPRVWAKQLSPLGNMAHFFIKYLVMDTFWCVLTGVERPISKKSTRISVPAEFGIKFSA